MIAHATDTKRLVDQAALSYLQNKSLKMGFSHYDVWLYEHSVAFTVAKMMDEDLLEDTRNLIVSAMQNGETFDAFRRNIMPRLAAKGWWGIQEMTDPLTGEVKQVQLGSLRRLHTIFYTNVRSAQAAGKWQRIEINKDRMPYLKYLASTSEHKRESHMVFYGRIYRVDDPFWEKNYPPNGYGCKCGVRQLTEKQALRERKEDIARDIARAKADKAHTPRFTRAQIDNAIKGILDDVSAAEPIPEVEFTNPRTGQKTLVPQSVTPSFAFNPADRLVAMQRIFADKLSQRMSHAAADALLQEFAQRQADDLLVKIRSITPSGSLSEQVQFEMARLIHLPPMVGSRVYEKMLEDKGMMKTLTEDVRKNIEKVQNTSYTDNTMALHIGTLTPEILSSIEAKGLPEPKTAVISFNSSRFGHGTRDGKKALDNSFWENLPMKLREPEAVYYDAGGHGNKDSKQEAALLLVYASSNGKQKLIVTIDYEVKKYKNPTTGKKETLLTNMVNSGRVVETMDIKKDHNIHLIWGK